MSKQWSNYSDLTRVFIATAIATAGATILNIFLTQWFLVAFFGVIAVATGLMAFKKMRQEGRA